MPNTVPLFPQNYTVTNDPTATLLNNGTNGQIVNTIGDGIPSAIEVILEDLIDGFLTKLKEVTGIDLIGLANSIIDLPKKTWEFIKVDLFGLVIDLFTGQFGKFFSTIWGWVTNFVGITGHGGIIGTILTIGQWIMGLFGTSHNGSTSLLGRVFNWIKGLIGPGISHFLATAWELIGGVFKLFGGAGAGGGSAFSGIWNVLKSLWNWISGPFKGLWSLVQDGFKLFGGGTGGAGGSGIWNFAKGLWDKVAGFFKGAFNIVAGIFNLFGGASNGSSAFSGAWNVLKSLWNWISGPFKGLWSLVQDIFKLFGGGSGGGGTLLSNTWNTVKKLWDKVAGWFGGIFSFFGGIFGLFSGGGSGGGSIVSNLWNTVKSVFNRITGFIMGAWRTVQGIWNWFTGPNSIIGQAKKMFSGSTTLSTRFGTTSIGGLVTDVASIVSNPAGGDKSLTQTIWSAIWDKINCWGFVGKIFSFFHNVTGFFSNPAGTIKSLFGSIWDWIKGKVGGLFGGLLGGGNISSAFNFFGSPMSPGGTTQIGTLASDLMSKAGSFLGLGDTTATAGGLFGTGTNVLTDFMTVLGAPSGLGTGATNWTLPPMLPPVNLFNSYGTLAPYQYSAMPAGAVAVTPPAASNLVNEGAFRAAITVVDGQGWSYDNLEGHTIPGSLRVDADGDLNEMVANPIPTVAGQSYTLSVYIKWLGLSYTGSDPICIGITGYSYEPLTKTYTELESVDVATLSAPGASGGWQQVTGTYTVPAINTPDVVRFRLKIGGNLTAGSVWFDEVSAVSTDLVRDNVIPGIGTILNNGVNGLENLSGIDWAHTDFFSAMFGQNAATIGLATRVNQLEALATAGVLATDDFERVNATDLGTNWVQVYSGPGAGAWATPNGHDASWVSSGISAREVVCRFVGTGATSNSDTQKITAVLGSKAETDPFAFTNTYNDLIGRLSVDGLNYIRARFGSDNTVQIHKCMAGVLTQIGATASVTAPSSGASIALLCGTASGVRYFQAHINGQAVDFGGGVMEVNDATSNFGAAYRGWGQGVHADNHSYTNQLLPGKYNSWAAIDN